MTAIAAIESVIDEAVSDQTRLTCQEESQAEHWRNRERKQELTPINPRILCSNLRESV
jgi:hypothetical protein